MRSARQLSKVLRTKCGFRQWIAASKPLPSCNGERAPIALSSVSTLASSIVGSRHAR
jgi:hypothetical protein